MKQFVALARDSSREQEREGFSLEVQVDALRRYATQNGGEIIKLFRIAETASKRDERKTFKEMIAFAKKNCLDIEALLFYKVDRAARNLFDYVELERLETDYNVPFISVSQPTDNTPAGHMMRRTLANMASFFTEQMSVDIKQGLCRRVQEGWFVGPAPYGYCNVRRDGRSIVEVEPQRAANVRRMFHLYAFDNLTLEGVVKRLTDEGCIYRESSPRFNRTSVHTMLRDRAYIGEIQFRNQWYPGKQEPLIDRSTWERVQALLGGHVQHSHTLTYAGEEIQCGHCGHPITGERKTKKSGRVYTYYRCTYYNAVGHPRTRVTEADLDRQVLALFDKMRIEDEAIRDWFRAVLASQTKDAQADSRAQRAELLRQQKLLVGNQDRLLNMRINDEIDQESFCQKQTELRDRQASIKLQLEVVDRSHDETADLALKVLPPHQNLWVNSGSGSFPS